METLRNNKHLYNARIVQKFISIVLCATLIAPANAAMVNITRADTCDNAEYRRTHPTQCSFFASTAMPILGGGALLGGALALIGASSSGDATATPAPQQYNYFLPTMQSTPGFVGGDVSHSQLASIMGTSQYQRNTNQYNDINLAYSIARGYTGAGTTIAVLDSAPSYWHGGAVAEIASAPIAPNANIVRYTVTQNASDFISFHDIGDIIASAGDANVYNASWSVDTRATAIHSRSDMAYYTDSNFIAQISTAATERDAIFVWAAGNDGDNQSSALSAMPRVMPELNGHFVNVVALDSQTGELASYSNACGVTKEYCITAPGTDFSVSDKSRPVSGTSFAAPVISAAIAVLREAFPYMQSTEITELLFTTAQDIGDAGVDEIYGWGLLDMERATRPVGAALVPTGTNNTMQPLQTARVSARLAHNIQTAGINFAFFDDFGRPFETNLNDHISAERTSRAFSYLRDDKSEHVVTFNNIEIGTKQHDFLLGDGFLKTENGTTAHFVGFQNDIKLGHVTLFSHNRFSMMHPHAMPESMVSDISSIFSTSVTMGAKYNDWTFSVSAPDTILSGNMNLHMPTGRASDGQILYTDYSVSLITPPAPEYSVSYKFITATFVDNPYGTDEVFVIAKHKLYF